MSEAFRCSGFANHIVQLIYYAIDERLNGKMDVTQRRMLRKIVGWIRFDDEDWEVTGRRMKARLEAGLRQYPIKTWSERRAN